MICGACGHEAPATAKFCPECGAQFHAEVACPRCGATNAAANKFCLECGSPIGAASAQPAAPSVPLAAAAPPTSFVGGRYQVLRFLGEGGKKRVYLAHDAKLDRDVAFALIKTDGLDDDGLLRIKREAQAMGRLGDHPHIVSVYDIGEEAGQPYIVTQLMGGGDVEGLIEKAEGHRLPLDVALRIADQVCQALEYAHGKGIIHRDLKPGNVWLTGDPDPQPPTPSPSPQRRSPQPPPVAKLGDFGLAVALDKTRLTQAGMMVGTVSYMPPEQAIGGEVSPRSDLYSLGAMLYEMTCGRPPFVGDESVAIITQHLNTPPVAPSWHAPDLPAGLEALILRLLEKDPGKRPGSAGEVQGMLAGVGARPHPSASPLGDSAGLSQRERRRGELPLGEGGGEGASSAQSPTPSPQNPLYSRTFVGRESELRQLQGAFDAALSGQGSLTMVVGEPGIGKTSLCEQLATYVAVRGGMALVGHCYEEGSLSLPYLPFVEAMRSYVLTREPEGLRKDLGSGAAEVARIVSEIRDKVGLSPAPSSQTPTPSPDPEEDRWRLLQAVSGFLRNASLVQPIMIVLEDLHDADRGSIDLLLHLSRNLRGARLLIVGTYRDVEVDRTHPLSGALAELRRSGSFLRVPLRGLTVDEVQRMMSIVRGQEVPWSRAEAIHRQTEGNPLFVQEVLRYLVEEGLVVREGGRYTLADPTSPDAGIPEGLRDVVGKRLSRLSEKANHVLSVASVIGREFRLDVLQKVANLPEEELYGALEEANERAVVEQRQSVGTVGFRFTHAFFRQTLYEEIFVPRRIRLHQQVGKALEEIYGRRLEEHAAELAEHFVQSTEPGDLEKALRYCELAARRAMVVFAYGEAVRHLEQALRTQEVLDPDDKLKRCDLLLTQAEAMLPLEEPARIASTVAEEAFTLAEGLTDDLRAARAAILACESRVRAGLNSVTATAAELAEYRKWAGRADRHAPDGSPERVLAEMYQGSPTYTGAAPAEAHVHLKKAIGLALELGDNALIFAAGGLVLLRLGALQDREFVERIAREVLQRPREGVRAGDLARCLASGGRVLLDRGERELAEVAWRDLAQLAERTRDASASVLAMRFPLYLAFLDGRIDEALSLSGSASARSQELGIGSDVVVESLRLYRGLEIERDLSAYEAPTRPAQARKAVMLAHLGRHEEARAIRERFGDIGSPDDESSTGILLNLFEAAILGGDAETVRALVPRLAPLAAHLQFGFVSGFDGSIGRLLGDAAGLLGNAQDARAYYQQALEVCAKVRFRPEIAIIRLHLAELMLAPALTPALSQREREQQRTEALAHLDFAIEEFRAMKMQPFLERALRHKGLLGA